MLDDLPAERRVESERPAATGFLWMNQLSELDHAKFPSLDSKVFLAKVNDMLAAKPSFSDGKSVSISRTTSLETTGLHVLARVSFGGVCRYGIGFAANSFALRRAAGSDLGGPVRLDGNGVCVLNARRCHRLHCYISGPVFLLGAVAPLVDGSGSAATRLAFPHSIVRGYAARRPCVVCA